MKQVLTIAVASLLLAFSAACATFQGGAAPSFSAISSRDITIENNGVALAASILKPDGANGVGVVMLAGSGPAERRMIRPAAEILARFGYTVLIYDKRGSGESTGNWMTSSLTDIAGDAIAALNGLSEHEPGLSKTGYWMHSQGNWVAAKSLELGAKPDFMIAVSGGGASPREVETYAYRFKLSRYGKTDQDRGMKVVDRYFAYLGGEMSRAEFDAWVADVSDQPWYQGLGLILVSETNRPNWAWVANWDPAAATAQSDVPTFVLLGGLDHTIPLDLSVKDWNRQIGNGAASGSQITILSGRDHHMNIVQPHLDGEEGGEHGGRFHGMTTDLEFWSLIDYWLSSQP